MSILLGACGSSSSSAPPVDGPVDAGIAHDATTDASCDCDAFEASIVDGAVNDLDVADGFGNGAPSDAYPAPHPPLPDLVNKSGGPVLATPKIYLVFYPNYPYESDLQSLAQKMTTSPYWAATTSEYGVGALAYGGTIELTSQTPPTNISSSDIQSWVAKQIQSGTFGVQDPEGIYTIVYPQGTTFTQPNPVLPILPNIQSCVGIRGYHDNVSVAVDGGAPQNFAYAVIATCTPSADSVTSVTSHEWVEAATDPLPTSNGSFSLNPGPAAAYFTVDSDHTVWGVLHGGEAGDLCEPEGAAVLITPADLGHLVQRTWSNVLAKGSHDPCAPSISGAFFDSAPVLPETVTFTLPIISTTVTSKGITIPVGQTKTIEVDLFSDAPTGGPWTVQADDLLYKYYGNFGVTNSLSFQWDRTQGVNGEKLHLSITVTQGSPLAGAHGFMITSTLGARIAVWPGLIVE
jgi:hypothetical protein